MVLASHHRSAAGYASAAMALAAGIVTMAFGWRVSAPDDAEASALPQAMVELTSVDTAATVQSLDIPAPTTPGTAPLLAPPLGMSRVTSGFGWRLHPILGYSRMHQGVDLAAPEGSPVMASADGVVEQAEHRGGYGNWVLIRHAGALETGYAHLSAYATGVAEGAKVLQGQVIGYVGHTGLATGPHLHYEVHISGLAVNPIAALTTPAMTGRIEPPPFFRRIAIRSTTAHGLGLRPAETAG
ncbi:MAG: M23 family metallopeptidase [Caulobacterales bacterium]